MRAWLLGVLWLTTSVAAHAETYSFTSVVNGAWYMQTLVHCVGPAKGPGRVPVGCTLTEPAEGFPNVRRGRAWLAGVRCAAGHPINFHPNGTLADCMLDGEQALDTIRSGTAMCFGYAFFDENGLADCD